MKKWLMVWFLVQWLVAAPAAAEEAGLKSVMQHLGAQMRHISDGLLVADFAAVAKSARTIAGHGHLSRADTERIERVLGSAAGSFHEADHLVHHRALELAEAAKRRDAPLALQRYGELLGACIACHDRFREPLRTP